MNPTATDTNLSFCRWRSADLAANSSIMRSFSLSSSVTSISESLSLLSEAAAAAARRLISLQQEVNTNFNCASE